MRSLLTLMKQAINSEYFAGEVPLLLFSIETSVADPYRIVHNTEDIIANGLTYKAQAFTCQLLDEREGELVSTTMTYYDIDLELLRILKLEPGDITINGRFIMASAPDDDQLPSFSWISMGETWNDQRELAITVGPRTLRGSSFPAQRINPVNTPGSFGGTL